MDTTLDTLKAAQMAKIAELEAELAQHIADGNELYAKYTQDDLVAAKSPARLIHKAPKN